MRLPHGLLRLWVRLVGSHVVLVVVLATTMSMLVHQTGTVALRTAVLRGHREVARRASEEIRHFVHRSIANLEAVAVAMNVERAQWQRQSLLSQAGLEFQAIEEICLIDTQGAIVATSVLDLNSVLFGGRPLPAGYVPDVGAMWRDVLAGKTYNSPMTFAEGRPGLIVALPVHEGERLAAVLVARLALHTIWQQMDGLRIEKTGRGVLLDRDGSIIAHPLRQVVYQHLTHEQWERLHDESGFIEWIDADGKEWIAGFAAIPELGWTVVVEQEGAEAFSLVVRMRNHIGVITLVSVGVAVLLGFLLLRSITKPLDRFAGALHEFGQGQLPATEDLRSRKDEIGELSQAFHEMGESLEARRSELEAAVAFQTHLVESSPVGLAVVDPNWNVLQANQAWADSFHIESAGPMALAECAEGRQLQLWLQEQREDDAETDLLVNAGDGSTRYWRVNAVDLADAYPGRTLVLLEDRTERRALELSVRQNEKLGALGEIAAGLAHEIKNPLAIMQGASDLLRRLSPDEDEPREEALKALEGAIERTNSRIGELLDFARPASDAPQAVDVNEVLRLLISLSKQHALHLGIQLEQTFAAVGSVYINRDTLKDVFLNLISNALDAMTEGGVLRVSTHMQNGHVVAEIADSGEGIPQEDLSRIFDPFYTTKSYGHGTGLGLSIGYRQIRQAGGDMVVESSVGKGTVFMVYLPEFDVRG